MTQLTWRYDVPFLRPGTAVAFTGSGKLVGAYRKRYRSYRVTYDLIGTQPWKFHTEDEVRDHLQAVADRRVAS